MILSNFIYGWQWHDSHLIVPRRWFVSRKGCAIDRTEKEQEKNWLIFIILKLSVFAWLETILESVHNPSSSIILFLFSLQWSVIIGFSVNRRCKMTGGVAGVKRLRFVKAIISSMKWILWLLASGAYNNFLTQFV